MRIDQNLSDVVESDKPKGSFPALPNGWYRMMGDDTDYKDTNAGDGKYLKITMIVLDQGPYFNRKHWEQFNLVNPNAMAVEIGRRQLKELATAMGHPTPNSIADSDELVSKAFVAKVIRKKAKDGYGDDEGFENSIVEYRSVAYHQSVSSPAAAAPVPAQEQDLLVGDDDAPF